MSLSDYDSEPYCSRQRTGIGSGPSHKLSSLERLKYLVSPPPTLPTVHQSLKLITPMIRAT